MKELRRRALRGDVKILKEYPEAQLEADLDEDGLNSYQYLAQIRREEIVKYIGAYKLRNKKGLTAIEMLMNNSYHLTREDIIRLFPWYTPPENEEPKESLKTIHEMSNSQNFILT